MNVYTDVAVRVCYVCNRNMETCKKSACGIECNHTTDKNYAAYRVHDSWNAFGDPEHGIITLMEKKRRNHESGS